MKSFLSFLRAKLTKTMETHIKITVHNHILRDVVAVYGKDVVRLQAIKDLDKAIENALKDFKKPTTETYSIFSSEKKKKENV